MITNYIYTNNSTQFQPIAGNLMNGAVALIQNLNTAGTSDAYPLVLPRQVYRTIMIVADTWATAQVTINVSVDGVTNWTPLTDLSSAPLVDIKANTYATTVVKGVYIQAVVTGAGTNVTVALAG